MRAVRFHGPKNVSVSDVDEPRIEHPRDALLRVTSTAICGSDLHIYNAMIPQVKPMTLGHEFMGIVEEVGNDVDDLQVGDRVVVPFPIADGTCWFCTHGLPTQCENSNPNYGPGGGLMKEKGAALYGYTDLYGGYEGGQAEMVRVPYADYGPRKVPDGLRDEEVLFLSDILPTGWTGVKWADVQPGETVAVFGCGPVGLMAQKAARHHGAEVIGIDVVDYRLDMARRVAGSEVLNDEEGDTTERIRDMTDGRGADVVIDAVGMEAERGILEQASAVVHLQRGTLKVVKKAMDAVRRGGRVSLLGVYGTPYDNFPLHQAFDKEVQLNMGQAPVHNYIDELMGLIRDGALRADDIITHVLPLDEAAHGYRIFAEKEDECVKVVLKP